MTTRKSTGWMSPLRMRVRVRSKRISSRSHTIPVVRASSRRTVSEPSAIFDGRAALLTSVPPPGPRSHARRYHLGVRLADLTSGVVQEHVVEGGLVYVNVQDRHADRLDQRRI